MTALESEAPVRLFGDPRFKKVLHGGAAYITGSPNPELFDGWQALTPDEHIAALRYLRLFFYWRARFNRVRLKERKGIETALRSAGQVMLLRDGPEGIEAFLGKRTVGSFINQWGSPGGSVDAGEQVRTASVRETKEEAGVEVAEDELVPLLNYVSHFARKKEGRIQNTEFRVSLFAVRADGLEPYNASPHEHAVMKWHTVKGALTMHEQAAASLTGGHNDYAEDTLTPSVLRVMRQLKQFKTLDEAFTAIGVPSRAKAA